MKYSLRNFFITFLISLVIFGAAVLLIFGYVQKDLGSMLGSDTIDRIITEDTTEQKIKADLTLLLVCRDGDGLASSMTLMKIDKAKEDFIFISVPASIKLDLDGKTQTLKEVSGYRDIDYLKNKVTALTGISIDSFIEINRENAAAFLDKLGEITFDVPFDIENDDEERGPVLNIGAGEQTFDGKSAVDMLTYNGYKDGDKTRLNLLREFLQSICQKYFTADYKSKVSTASLAEIYNLISTDYPVNSFISNIEMFFGYPNYKKISIGYSGSYKADDSGNVVCTPNIADAISDFADYR